MLNALRKAILALNLEGERRSTGRMLRRLTVSAAALARRGPGAVTDALAGIQETADRHAAEVATWVGPEALAAGRGGPFDACDLRHWLALAERAGVPAVPAVEVLLLDEAEMAALSGTVAIPDNATTRGLRRRLAPLAAGLQDPGDADGGGDADMAGPDRDSLRERLAAAMDGVPEGWMVRSARCGGSELKALSGVGAAGPAAPGVRFGPGVEVGPGWVRRGNRRYVNAGDSRTVEAYAQGPGGPCAFLARPWVEASRWATGEDPHRHGTPFAGKGTWPAEWRAFVEGGVVVGVASYYGWCGSATPENARMALAVRERAARIAGEAVAQRAFPRYMDVEFVRMSGHPDLARPQVREALDRLGREGVACTLDFIETADGPLLLEGGPPNTPFGGGHPCAFAGCGGPPRFGNRTLTEGVAFRTMPHVLLGSPATWTEGERAGCILTWDEVLRLAGTDAPAAA